MNLGRFGYPGTLAGRVFSENLLANPGFELGNTAGWSAVSGYDQGGAFTTSDRGTDASGTPRSGAYLWCPNASARSALQQDIDVSLFASHIDAGMVDAQAVAWFMSDDSAIEHNSLSLVALDLGGAVIGAIGTASIQPRPNHVWFPVGTRLALPPQTRTVRYTFFAERLSGTNNNSNVDDCSLTLLVLQ
jgi:hypothetical protein